MAYEWEIIKDCVDEIREGYFSGGAIDTLRNYDLWDNENHDINQEHLTKLYMEYC